MCDLSEYLAGDAFQVNVNDWRQQVKIGIEILLICDKGLSREYINLIFNNLICKGFIGTGLIVSP